MRCASLRVFWDFKARMVLVKKIGRGENFVGRPIGVILDTIQLFTEKVIRVSTVDTS